MELENFILAFNSHEINIYSLCTMFDIFNDFGQYDYYTFKYQYIYYKKQYNLNLNIKIYSVSLYKWKNKFSHFQHNKTPLLLLQIFQKSNFRLVFKSSIHQCLQRYQIDFTIHTISLKIHIFKQRKITMQKMNSSIFQLDLS